MFRDDKAMQEKVMDVLAHVGKRVGLLESLPLVPLAGEACNHFDNQDDCTVTVRCSIQFAYSGCPDFAAGRPSAEARGPTSSGKTSPKAAARSQAAADQHRADRR